MRLIRYDPRVDGKVETLRPVLQAVVHLVAHASYVLFKKPLIVTCVDREPLHDGDLHALNRALDFDVDEKGHYGGLSPDETQRLVDLINKYVCYDPQRPHYKCAVYGHQDRNDKHWNHVHLQVHPRTIIRSVFS